MRFSLANAVALAGIVALAAGCSAVAKDAGFSDVRGLVAARIGHDPEWNREEAEDEAVAGAVRNLLEQDLTAGVAVQVALLNNRNLQATYEDLGVARADLIQAGLLRNPVITFERRFSGQALELDVVQEFIELITLPLRKRVAGAAFEATKQHVAAAVLDLAAEVSSTFYALQGTEQMVAMRRQVVQGSAAAADLAQRMYDAGNITDLDLRMEQRLTRQAQLDLAVAEQEVIQQRERLNALMGLWGAETAWTISPRLPDPPLVDPPLQGLESLAVSQRLDLLAARQDIMMAAETLGLTNALRWLPGVSGHLHLEREPDGMSTIGPGLEILLPVFDWGQAAVPRDRALLRQKQQRYTALAIEIRSQVRAAYSRMRTARERAEFYRQTVLPLQLEILEQAQLQYNAMILGPLHLFQLKQAEIDTGREYIEAHRDYWVARTQLEHALGGSIKSDETGGTAARTEEAPGGKSANNSHSHHDEEVQP
jgi:cobalt-zinc-cadmium efflux system outer membrane protein